jgi:hypothetical protein
MLARAPSLDTKWIFEPVPGGSIYRWYIRMSVSRARNACLLLPAAACCCLLLPAACCLLLLHRVPCEP